MFYYEFRNYRKDYIQQGDEYWRCTITGYTGRLKTSNGGKLVELISNNHSHDNIVDNETMQVCALRVKQEGDGDCM